MIVVVVVTMAMAMVVMPAVVDVGMGLVSGGLASGRLVPMVVLFGSLGMTGLRLLLSHRSSLTE